MNPSFRMLKVLSVALKVLACIFLILMLVTVVAILLSKEIPNPLQPLAGLILQGVALFAGFYAFGDVIRLLLTRKE